jgi:hypothetical protein
MHADDLRADGAVAVRQSSENDARKCDNLEEESRRRDPNMW